MSTLRYLLIASASIMSACAVTLVYGPIESNADEWKLVLVKLRRGPDSYKTSSGYIEPESGAWFLWLDVRLKNETASTRRFNYESCDLDAGEHRVLPSIVHVDPDSEAPDWEKLEPSEEITRTLIFSYPDGRMPTRLKCGALSIPLKLRQSSNGARLGAPVGAVRFARPLLGLNRRNNAVLRGDPAVKAAAALPPTESRGLAPTKGAERTYWRTRTSGKT